MKPRRGNITRGSQLIETFSMLFAAGLKPMLWVLATLFLVGRRRNSDEPAPRAIL
jgi:hypothetical protein